MGKKIGNKTMIKSYNDFMNPPLNEEAKISPKIKRDELKIGDKIMTNGEFDGVNLDYLTGTILNMREYGNLLIQFDRINKKFHAGFKDIGANNHCFYIPLDNITSNDSDEFEKIIKKVEDEKKNKEIRMKAKYNTGDVIVGINKIKPVYSGKELNIEDEIGIVYYSIDNNNYWVGFLDRFDDHLKSDSEGYPKNKAGISVNKLNMRHAEADEIEKFKDKINKAKKEIGVIFEIDDIVAVDGNYNYIHFKNNIGIIREVQQAGAFYKRYTVQFLERFDNNLYDINYMMGTPTGYIIPQSIIRKATEEEIKQNDLKLKLLKEDIDSFNYDYKIGDYIVAHNSPNYNIPNMDGQIGVIVEKMGNKPRETFGVSFLVRFNNNLYNQKKWANYVNLNRTNISIIKGGEGEELKRKLDNKEIMTFLTSDALSMLLNRMDIKIRVALLNNSYFDIDKEKNDIITYLPIDRFKRLEKEDNPYNSKLRQQMKIGKFFRVINDKLIDKEVETLINSFRSNYDICIKGVSDKLKLVSGEDVRFWYNEKNYVHGGGMLNSSCMRHADKGPEMQMFVDNPDVIQLLILLDDNNKLLGRSLVWRLAKPEGSTFMDYVYTRFDKDRDIFLMYGSQHGWIMRDKNNYSDMICALHTDKKYQQGINALDHFDTFHLVSVQNCLTNGNIGNWKNPYMIKGAVPGNPPDDVVKIDLKPIIKFKEGDKIIYKKEKSIYDGKTGIFSKMKLDGKYSIIFDDGKKFATDAKNVFPLEEKK